MGSHYLPEVLTPFLRAHPGLSASLQSLDSPGTAQAVATGRADIGLSQFEVALPGLQSEVLCNSEAVCVLPPDHRLVGEARVTPVALSGERLIALAAVNPLRARVDSLFEAAGVAPHTVVDTPDRPRKRTALPAAAERVSRRTFRSACYYRASRRCCDGTADQATLAVRSNSHRRCTSRPAIRD